METLPNSEAVRSIAWSIVWSVLTCGIYNVYWNYQEMRTLNGLLGREELSFWAWAVFSLLTCGLFHIYYEYKMSLVVMEIQRQNQLEASEMLPLLSIGLSVCGLSIIVDAIQQHEINRVYARRASQSGQLPLGI